MDWRIVWSDECAGNAGTAPDPALWQLRASDEWHSSAEKQRYTDDASNAHYDGQGRLVINAIRDSANQYTSARLRAANSGFLLGRFEASIRVPTGIGIWPAWWLLGPDDMHGWPRCGEIDIMEMPVSADSHPLVHQGVHTAHQSDQSDVAVGVLPIAGDWHSAFHEFAIEWRPGRIDFFVDQTHTGVVGRNDVETRGGTWPFDDTPQSPILNLAVGGWAGEPDGRWRSQSMLIEYVRVYQ